MKYALVILLSLFNTIPLSNGHISGCYHNYFGERIELKNDSTFRHSWRFDLASSWSQGNWSELKDTIYLEIKFVYDTVAIVDSVKMQSRDSLVLSMDTIANRISLEQWAISTIAGGGQYRFPPPERLFYRNNKLYLVKEDGTLDRKKRKQFWSQKMKKPYFLKDK